MLSGDIKNLYSMLSELVKDMPSQNTDVKEKIIKNAEKTKEDIDKKNKEVKMATKNLKNPPTKAGISIGGTILKLFSFIAGCGIVFALIIFFRMRGDKDSRFDGEMKKFC